MNKKIFFQKNRLLLKAISNELNEKKTQKEQLMSLF